MSTAQGITAMRRVSAYRTQDNVLHSERGAAIRHQAKLDLKEWLKDEALLDPEAADIMACQMIENGPHLLGILKLATKDNG